MGKEQYYDTTTSIHVHQQNRTNTKLKIKQQHQVLKPRNFQNRSEKLIKKIGPDQLIPRYSAEMEGSTLVLSEIPTRLERLAKEKKRK